MAIETAQSRSPKNIAKDELAYRRLWIGREVAERRLFRGLAIELDEAHRSSTFKNLSRTPRTVNVLDTRSKQLPAKLLEYSGVRLSKELKGSVPELCKAFAVKVIGAELFGQPDSPFVALTLSPGYLNEDREEVVEVLNRLTDSTLQFGPYTPHVAVAQAYSRESGDALLQTVRNWQPDTSLMLQGAEVNF